MIKLRIEEFDSRKKRLSELVTYRGYSINIQVDNADSFEQNIQKLNYKFIRTFGGDFDGSDFDAYSKRVGDFEVGANYFYPSTELKPTANVYVHYADGKSGNRSMEEIDAMLSDLDLGSIEGLKELERILLRITNESVRRNGRRSRLVRESKEDTVYVVFRKERKPTEDDIFYGNDVTAFIYGEGIPVNYGKVMCYQHVGQHGEASLEYYNSLKPASPDEYADLLAELKSIYDDVNLVVRKKLDYNILSSEWRR